MPDTPRILILAGEMSGDLHGARLLRAMKQRAPGLQAWGYGGDALAAEGMELREHIRTLSVMGLVEVLKHYRYFQRIFTALEAEVRSNPPDLILLIDYPGFNLRFAKAVRDLHIPTVQYICPQVWAWKQSRIPKMARILDRLLCIFPFEPPLFSPVNLPAFYCGHPLVEETLETVADPDWQAEGPKLALLPGSRQQEIDRLFLPMLLTAARLQTAHPALQVRVAAATRELQTHMEALANTAAPDCRISFSTGKTRALVKGADAALVTSGTATLETALLGIPMLVVYKTSALTYAIGKRIVKVKHIGMVNLVAEEEVCPEFLQERASPDLLAPALSALLQESPQRRQMLTALQAIRGRLTGDGGGERPAELILELLQTNVGKSPA